MEKDTLVKIVFDLEQDEEGYPPFTSESVWAKRSLTGNFIIDNLPFYIYDISLDDEIAAKDKDGELLFQKTIKKSKNSNLRVYCTDKLALKQLRASLNILGCKIEISNISSLIAINIPFEVSLKDVEKAISKIQISFPDLEYEYASIRQ